MHDNDRKHTSGLIKDWLKRKRIQTFFWLPYSPDLILIEIYETSLSEETKKTKKKKKNTSIENITELKLLLIEESNKFELSVLEKLEDSVPNRLYECIKMKDYPTKYELSFI